MNEIKAYQTKDGKIFSTAEEAQDHEDALGWDLIIAEYASSPYCTYRQPQLSMVRKTIISWEKFKAERGFKEK